MVAEGAQIIERRPGGPARARGGRDALRWVVWLALGVCLMPAALVVLLVSGLGVACCAVARWLGAAVPGRAGLRRDGPARAGGTRHVAASFARSSRR